MTLLDRRPTKSEMDDLDTELERRAAKLEAERYRGRCIVHGRRFEDLCELCLEARGEAS